VRITADTNLLVRAITGDHPRQSRLAQAQLAQAELVAVAMPALCELAWVLSRGYAIPSVQVAEAIRRLIGAANVAVDRPAAEAGLAQLEAGGDFADAVIAHEGAWLGGEIFVSFDRKAVKLMPGQGVSAHLLS
jgi:predicted nucleic-acid-binding protein